MRCLLVVLLLLSSGCPEEEPAPSGPPRCEDCDNDPSCPDFQPTLNPLMDCQSMDATCFYCGPVMRRYVCQPAANGDLQWQDNGEADMCPPPSEDGSAGTG
ncbi:MAG: hypothetical protein K0V04_45605 [Deltaproteobacteria bacterium]|nr:hypothetical protein [Deltaproteobacteria bacterium]